MSVFEIFIWKNTFKIFLDCCCIWCECASLLLLIYNLWGCSKADSAQSSQGFTNCVRTDYSQYMYIFNVCVPHYFNTFFHSQWLWFIQIGFLFLFWKLSPLFKYHFTLHSNYVIGRSVFLMFMQCRNMCLLKVYILTFEWIKKGICNKKENVNKGRIRNSNISLNVVNLLFQLN